jgi:polyisoprenoid-binding protein YceI
MRGHNTKTTLAILCLAPAAIAWTSAATRLTLRPDSKLWITGTSTVRGFQCAATAFETKIEATDGTTASSILGGAKAVQTAELTVPAKRLDCRNGTMNEHMLKAIKANDHPTIAFEVSTYDVAKAAAGAQGTANGELTLGGVTRPITVTGIVTEEADGSLHIAGSYALRMTEFGLKPPTLMMGTMKVNERVTVNFDLRLKS